MTVSEEELVLFRGKSTQQAATTTATLRSTVALGCFSLELKRFNELMKFHQLQVDQRQELWIPHKLLEL